MYCSHSLETIQTQLSQYTSALDILVERSRQSWNKVPTAILPSGHESLRFSFISHMSRFSTTALYMNQICDRESTIAFDFDYEVTNSRIYKRAIADDARRASIANFRVSLADSSPIAQERWKYNQKGFGAEATYPHTRAINKARGAPNQAAQIETPNSRVEISNHLRSMSQGPLHEQQPRASRNFFRPRGSITSGPSDAAAAAAAGAVAPTGDSSQDSSIVDLEAYHTGPAASSPVHPRKSVGSHFEPMQPIPEIQLPQINTPRVPKYLREYRIAVLGGEGSGKSALVIQVSNAI
jgi:hypothetical protein